MKPPAHIQVGPIRYQVKTDKQAVDKECREQGSDAVGFCTEHKQLILLDPDQGPDSMAETLLHEVLHAVVVLVGLSNEWKESREERVVRRLAPALLDLIRRNPKLVAYLQEET